MQPEIVYWSAPGNGLVGPCLSLPRRPGRLYLLATLDPPGAQLYLWPQSQADPLGIAPAAGQGAVYIPATAYPGLIDGDWYVWAPLLTTVTVIEAYRLP